MALTIDSLEIQIVSDAKKSTKGIDALAKSLGELNTALGGASGVSANLKSIADGLKSLSAIGKLKLTSSINQLTKLKDVMATLNGAEIAQFSIHMQGIAEGLSKLSTVGKTNIASIVNALKKIPEITASLDVATIDAFAQKIQRLTEIMTPLGVQMDAIARGFNALPNAIKRAISATNKQTQANNKLNKSYGGLFSSLSRIAAQFWTLYYSVSRIADVFGAWYNESNELIETLNLVTVAFGDAADEAKAYAKTVQDLMGIDMGEWLNNQAVFMQTLSGFGIAEDKAASMSKTLTQLGYDIASLWNEDTETVMQRLESAMTGQIKGMKNYGYNVSVAALQETALAMGIDESVRSMTEAQKATLRFVTIMRNADGTMGDMAKTINTPANAMRILSSMLTRLQRSLGDVVSVLVTRFIPWIQAAVELVTELAESLAVSFGFEIDDLPSNIQSSVSFLDEELENANESAEELKKQLMGFDELNILKSGNSETGLSAVDNIDVGEYDYDFLKGLTGANLEPYKEKLKEILELAGAIGVAFLGWKIATGFVDGLNSVRTLMSTIGTKDFQRMAGGLLALTGAALEFDGVKHVFEEGLDLTSFTEITAGGGSLWAGAALIGKAFGSTMIGGAIGALVAGIPMFVSGLYDAIVNKIDWKNGVLIPLGSTLGGLGVGSLVGTIIGSSVAPGLGTLIGLGVGLITDFTIFFWQKYEEIKSWFEEIPEWGKFLVKLYGFIDPLAGTIATIITAIKEWDVISPWIEEHVIQPVKDAFDGFVGKAKETWEKIKEPFKPAIEWFVGLFSSIGQTAKDVFYNIGVLASGCWEIVKATWEVTTWWFDYYMVQPLSKIFSDMWSGLVEGAKKAWQGVKDAFGSIVAWFSEQWTKIVQVFAPLGEFFVEIKDAIGESIKAMFNSLIRGLNSLFDGTFGRLNSLIGKLRSFKFAGIQPFSELKDISVPKIPLLADGGFPSTGQMFIAREAGPELVGSIGNKTAVANNDQIIQGIASGVYSAMMAAQEDSRDSGGTNARIVVQIGDRAVGEAAVRFINGQIVQTGNNPIYA